jgi:hypothetical protein
MVSIPLAPLRCRRAKAHVLSFAASNNFLFNEVAFHVADQETARFAAARYALRTIGRKTTVCCLSQSARRFLLRYHMSVLSMHIEWRGAVVFRPSAQHNFALHVTDFYFHYKSAQGKVLRATTNISNHVFALGRAAGIP